MTVDPLPWTTETMLPLWGLVSDRGRVVGVEFETETEERAFYLRGRSLGLREGDEVLVDVSCYGVGGAAKRWCRVKSISHGTAAAYPIKIDVPDRGVGQYSVREVEGWRRPLWLHGVIRDAEKPGDADLAWYLHRLRHRSDAVGT